MHAGLVAAVTVTVTLWTLQAQMCDEDPYQLPEIDEEHWFTGGHLGTQIQNTNWQVVNVTTPANFFHVLRRQVALGRGDGGPA